MPPETAEELQNEQVVDRGDDVQRDDKGRFTKAEVEEALPESAASSDEDAGEDDAPPPVLIPKSRYDFKAAQAKEAMKRAAELEAKLRTYEQQREPARKEPDFDAQLSDVNAQIAAARKDGDMEKVVELMDRKHELQIQSLRAQTPAATQVDPDLLTQQAIDNIRVDDLIDQLEEQFSFLVPENEDYDEDIVSEILDVRTALEARGYSRYDSMQRAAQYVLGASSRVAHAAEAPAAGPRKTDRSKNIDAARRIPPNVANAGMPSDAAGMTDDLPSVSKLSEKDFEALPDSVRRKMRGDFI
jgi:hypothetical protein